MPRVGLSLTLVAFDRRTGGTVRGCHVRTASVAVPNSPDRQLAVKTLLLLQAYAEQGPDEVAFLNTTREPVRTSAPVGTELRTAARSEQR